MQDQQNIKRNVQKYFFLPYTQFRVVRSSSISTECDHVRVLNIDYHRIEKAMLTQNMWDKEYHCISFFMNTCKFSYFRSRFFTFPLYRINISFLWKWFHLLSKFNLQKFLQPHLIWFVIKIFGKLVLLGRSSIGFIWIFLLP